MKINLLKQAAAIAALFISATASATLLPAQEITLTGEKGSVARGSFFTADDETAVGTDTYIHDITVNVTGEVDSSVWKFTYNPNELQNDADPMSFSATLMGVAGASAGPSTVGEIVFALHDLAVGVYTLRLEGYDVTGAGSWSGRITTVPVPAALLLFGSALIGFAGLSTRRKAA